ncbi:MAG TPA: DUF1302 family protein [Thauera sp.]|jgi:hypothetical protein|nr:DUF1302 family protein [Thauera sp.]HRA81445.1 DUF1302 family protein [Thauera sp.]
MRLHKKMKPIALALIGMGIASSAFAGEPIQFDNGGVLQWRVNSTYTLSTRIESRDSLLSSQATNANGNDGNNNFDRGDLTANRLSMLLDVNYKLGDSGLVMSASTFYDDVYHQSNDNSSATPPNKLGGAADAFNGDTKRYHGGYTRMLDAYAFTAFDVGSEGRMTWRLGRHAVSWGEALFFPGISLAQGPADGTKTGVPGTETKDQLLPEDQVSLQYEVNDKLSLLAHVQYGWHETIAPAVGSYLSTSDLTGPGSQCLGAGCVRRAADDEPGNTGQWGVGTRYRVTDETEVGLYYLNYHDRTPNLDIHYAGTATPYYQIRYQEDVKLVGATLSTTFGIATLGMEMSYKKDAPAIVKTTFYGGPIPTATTADILQTNVNTFINLGRTWLAPQSQLLAEVSYVDVSNPEARRVPGAGASTAGAPLNDQLLFGSYGLAFQALLSSTYPGIIENWELGTTVAYSRQLKGRTLLGGVGGEGDHRLSLGGTMTYKRNFQVGLTYLGYYGDASLDPIRSRQLTDRDQLSLTMKYSF